MSSEVEPECRLIVLSGCSGGGKSTLLDELARRGFATVPEPGRRIVAEEMAGDGDALPWRDVGAFLERAMAMARADYAMARDRQGWTFFDRGIVDAAAGLLHVNGAWDPDKLPQYHRRVFMTPPWPQIYVQDEERQHGIDEAIAEYERLLLIYPRLGYEVILVPQLPVAQRADFILTNLEIG